MLEFEVARERFVAVAPRLDSKKVALAECLGRVLAAPVLAECAIPDAHRSAMDGYALNVRDVELVPYSLRVEGEAPAGAARAVLTPGTAMRIFTGATVPEGANAVVMQEHVIRDEHTIRGTRKVLAGQNVRLCGEELAQGAIALDEGHRIHPGTLALLSQLDVSEVRVNRAPIVSILCTGSELRAPGARRAIGTIPESNSGAVAALALQAGAHVRKINQVADEADAIGAEIDSALAHSDVLITIGGVSVGDYDLVRPALEALGVSLSVHTVGIKPGKPITLGMRNEKLVISLPGNPLSALITFALLGLPLLRAMQSDRHPVPVPCRVPIRQPIKRDVSRIRVVIGSFSDFGKGGEFQAHDSQSAAATVALGQSDGFVIVEPGEHSVPAGTLLPYLRWSEL